MFLWSSRTSAPRLFTAGTLALGLVQGAAFAAQTPGEGGTYECWDRCSGEVSPNTSCYDSYDHSNSGPLITCGEWGGGSVPPPPVCTTDVCTSCTRPASGTVDDDFDGVNDRLEHDLAHKFFPDIFLAHAEEDLYETYLFNSRATPFTVQPITSPGLCDEALECLEIRYGIAYFHDRGDMLPLWVLPVTISGIGYHLGDSEFFVALVIRTTSWLSARDNPNSWQMIRDFTAAHWNGGYADSSQLGAYGYCPPNCAAWSYGQAACEAQSRHCSWFPGLCYGQSSQPGTICSEFWQQEDCYAFGCSWIGTGCYNRVDMKCYSGAPLANHRVYFASEGKHALYHTDDECDTGGVWFPILGGADECPGNQLSLRIHKGQLLQNVGSRLRHERYDTSIQHPDNCRLYDVWGDQFFGGADVTSYYDHFTAGFFWSLP